MPFRRTMTLLLIEETCGGMAAPEALWGGSNGVEWEGVEDASSLEYNEHNVSNFALQVAGQNWSSEVIDVFPRRLVDWVGDIKLPLVSVLYM